MIFAVLGTDEKVDNGRDSGINRIPAAFFVEIHNLKLKILLINTCAHIF